VIGQSVHGNCLIVGTCGVLIRGKAGSGKSQLTDTMLSGACAKGNLGVLVADDRVVLTAEENRVIATVPDSIAGMMEVRGFGLIETRYAPRAKLHLVVDLLPQEKIERLPDDAVSHERFEGVLLPVVCCPENSMDVTLRVLRWTFRNLFPGSPEYF
jgi:serine kinase of HPr protein (carbohydrate metabolism regulator)